MNGISWVGEADGEGNSMFQAAIINILNLIYHDTQCVRRDTDVILSVISDFKSILVQCGNLIPAHVIVLIFSESKSFGNEEGRTEPVLKKNRANRCVVRSLGIIKGQDN